SLRAGLPAAEISQCGMPWAAAFSRGFSHYIGRFVEFAGYSGIAEVEADPVRTRRFLEDQRTYGYDLIIQMHGNGQTSNPFVLDLKGRMTAGYYEKTEKSS